LEGVYKREEIFNWHLRDQGILETVYRYMQTRPTADGGVELNVVVAHKVEN
jgi:hypothetical protein